MTVNMRRNRNTEHVYTTPHYKTNEAAAMKANARGTEGKQKQRGKGYSELG